MSEYASSSVPPDFAVFDNGLLSFRYPKRAELKYVDARGAAAGQASGVAGLLFEFAPDAFLLFELSAGVAEPPETARLRADSVVDQIAAKLAAFGFAVEGRTRFPPAREATHEVAVAIARPPAPAALSGTSEVRYAHAAGVRYTAGGESYLVETRLLSLRLGTGILTVAHPDDGEVAAELARARDRIGHDLVRPSARE